MEIFNNISIGDLEEPNILHTKMERIDSKKDDEALKKVCKDFEAIFLSMIFKQMKKTIPEGGLIEKSLGSEIFEDMYIEEISKEISKRDGGLGIQEMLYQQFKQGYVSW
ncbi:flagellar protein FlgJ [Keratinibaculum paraultunense]|uniref:Flagellar protein FlgJ n=1 Tax=Keratinibaculum paraultunense TaxID=1278232 RepID=A0A4R3KU97_9FIRM|nr:rod-binding protein [Keratinibaculum paraultunense]QQY79166.1 rod-binding protein [Keratinibaculum paraultunense]TCS88550.1 flagellar protein FlgJ [Keratinibaculum paraultunense]